MDAQNIWALLFCFCFYFAIKIAFIQRNEWIFNLWSILLSLGGGRRWSAFRVSSWIHPECILCSTQRRKPRGRRTDCLRSGSLPWWTNLSWWRWPTGTDRAAPGPSGTRSQRWTKLSSKQGRRCGWRPEETVLSYVSLNCKALLLILVHLKTFTLRHRKPCTWGILSPHWRVLNDQRERKALLLNLLTCFFSFGPGRFSSLSLGVL